MPSPLYGYRSVVVKETMHLRRDAATLFFALIVPVVQLLLYGYAIDFDVRHIPTAVVDMDRTRESREYLQRLHNTQYLDITLYAASPGEAEQAIRSGRCHVAVVIPPDFARRSGTSTPPQVRVMVDGSDSQVATRARFAFAAPPSAQAVDSRVTVLYNPDSRTQIYMIPGLAAILLQLITVSLTSSSLVREREQGTLEQLMVSPVGRLGLMLGKLTPFFVLAVVEMCAILLMGWLLFDVRVAGSLVLLILASLPFIAASLAVGLLISTSAQNQAQAIQLTMLTMMPTILLSGFVFPLETMPGPLYLLSQAFPVTHFLQIIRGVVVRGAGFWDLWYSILALLILMVVLIAAATARFQKSSA
ncbi:MAG TPA: ABC transporter permease [Chthonomonadaceae bacterium]|nr:ABC transporter permease [Chthonomonadaceae bacterium]